MVKSEASTAGIFYLFLYNFGFIIPLAVVFGITYAGIGSEKLVTVFNRNLGVVKLLTAGVFVFFGLAMIFLG
jgi:cytochrome c biogenesis protein CcdA